MCKENVLMIENGCRIKIIEATVMDRFVTLMCYISCFINSGFSQGSDIGYFWHVTDFHYDHTYNNKLSCNSNITGQLPTYGDYWCDATWSLVVDSIQAMATIRSDVDFLIWTGDSVGHVPKVNLSTDINLQLIQNITVKLSTSFNKTPVYASLGNHDFYPTGQASPHANDLYYTNVTDLWQDWVINQSNAINDSRKGGFYAVKIKPKIRLLALNTNLYYTVDNLTPNISDPVGQFAWMENQLLQAKSNDEKVIVTGHVPPGLFIPEYADWFYPKFKTRFMEIILNYTDIIVALHFGHDHYDSFKILQSDDETKAVPQFTAPSVTPWRFKVNINGAEKVGDPHNPGLRLIKYNRTSGAHLDYSQYYINITMANAALTTAGLWKILYNFTSAYGVDDMSVDSLKKIFNKLNDNSSPLYQRFCNNWVLSDSDKRCTDAMRADILCGTVHQKFSVTRSTFWMARLTVCCFTIFLMCAAASNDNDIGYFWHVTDFHYDHTYNNKLSCSNNITGQLPAYGDYWCDATWRLVVDSIQAMKNIKPDVDFLIWTGDSVAHISDNNLSVELNLQVVQNVTDELEKTFKGTPVYASLGNHDFYPSGQASPEANNSFYSNINDMWTDWVINQSNAIADSKTGGFYAVKLKVNPKIRLLALNTNLYYTSDKLTPNISDPVGQFAWMENQLKEAKSNGEKVILTGHVPPGLFFPEYSDWYWPQFKSRFLSIIQNYYDVIVALNFGHDHYDSFKILQKEDGSSAVPQFVAPSVTPWRYKKPINGAEKTGDAHNPGLRLIKYNRTSGAQMDYSQYYINITDANAASGTAVWVRAPKITLKKKFPFPDSTPYYIILIILD
ncbi:Acid sphingomyelinase-like phosphodiesterase 3b [Bulinus truncatus]|nr:Acid sphingomyelinase-like phosphodiesterase 3b [Bulinus truncatus]